MADILTVLTVVGSVVIAFHAAQSDWATDLDKLRNCAEIAVAIVNALWWILVRAVCHAIFDIADNAAELSVEGMFALGRRQAGNSKNPFEKTQ